MDLYIYKEILTFKVISGSIRNLMKENSSKKSSQDYFKQRLKRYRPDLYGKVESGDMTVNKACVIAGYKHGTGEHPVLAAYRILERFTYAERKAISDIILDKTYLNKKLIGK